MKEKLEALREQALRELENLHTPKDLEEFRIRVMGKKGSLTELLRGMAACPPTSGRRSASWSTSCAVIWKRRWPSARRKSRKPSRPNGCRRKRST